MLAKLALLKPELKYLIIAECLDIITTAIGLSLGLYEGNPIMKQLSFQNILIFKILAISVGVFILQKINCGKIIIIFPIIAIIPVFWNLYILISITKIMYFGW